MSAKRQKSIKYLSLRELHLNPHFIYLVDSPTVSTSSMYFLELWKDQVKIDRVSQLTISQPTGSQKYSKLQFNKLRFVFDVEALFGEHSDATIKLKLTQYDDNQQYLREQFELHLLYYNYEYSNGRFIKQTQNSIGKINHYILNYSFSAIYGQPLETLLFRKEDNHKKDVLLEGLYLQKRKLKYGEIVHDQNVTKHIDTIFMLESIAKKEVSQIKTNQASNVVEQTSKFVSNSTFLEEPNDQQDEDIRNAKRQIIDDLPFQTEDSNMVQKQLAFQIITFSKKILYWGLIIISTYLVYFLMHPQSKI